MRGAVLLLSLALANSANAACPGRFADMAKLAGADSDKLLNHPAVRSRISKLMGSKVAHLKRNLRVARPVALIDCELVVEGNAAHQGGVQNAMISFDLYHGILTAALLDDGRIFVRSTSSPYRDRANYSHLPPHITDWIYAAADGFRSRISAPPNVLIEPAPREN